MSVTSSSAPFIVKMIASSEQIVLPVGLNRYKEEFSFARTDNWDGSGAVALTDQVIKLAAEIFDRCGGRENLVEVYPLNDGSLAMLWENADSCVYVAVGPRDTVHVFFQRGDLKWEGVTVATDPNLHSYFERAVSVQQRLSIFIFTGQTSNSYAKQFAA